MPHSSGTSVAEHWPQATGVTSLTSSHVSLPHPAGPTARTSGTSSRLVCQKEPLTVPKGRTKRRARGGSNSRRASRCNVCGGVGSSKRGAASAALQARQRAASARADSAREESPRRANGGIKRAPCALSQQVIHCSRCALACLQPRASPVSRLIVLGYRFPVFPITDHSNYYHFPVKGKRFSSNLP